MKAFSTSSSVNPNLKSFAAFLNSSKFKEKELSSSIILKFLAIEQIPLTPLDANRALIFAIISSISSSLKYSCYVFFPDDLGADAFLGDLLSFIIELFPKSPPTNSL